jgi:hypothetical protein
LRNNSKVENFPLVVFSGQIALWRTDLRDQARKVVLDLSQIEHYFRLSYVIILWVKYWMGYYLRVFFYFDYFKRAKIIIS